MLAPYHSVFTGCMLFLTPNLVEAQKYYSNRTMSVFWFFEVKQNILWLCCIRDFFSTFRCYIYLQCFDAVGLAAGRASGL